MKKKLLGILVVLSFGGLLISGASAQTDDNQPVYPPYSNTVGVYIDSINGDTNGTINCFTEGSDGKFETGPEGDATLFMVNRQPHRIWCVITIRKNYQTALES